MTKLTTLRTAALAALLAAGASACTTTTQDSAQVEATPAATSLLASPVRTQQGPAWQGVRDATQYGDVCVQNPAPTRFPPNGATDTPNFTGMSEDCLNLNIWTPAKKPGENLPVMVWLYGGAHKQGGGNAPF